MKQTFKSWPEFGSTTAKGNLRYRYYVCSHAEKHGCERCPTRMISAPKIERLVLEAVQTHLTENNQLPAWPENDLQKQARFLKQIVERVQYDAQDDELTIRLRADAARWDRPAQDQDQESLR